MKKYNLPVPPRVAWGEDKEEAWQGRVQQVTTMASRVCLSSCHVDLQRLSVKLFPYQLQTVAWMVELEREIEEGGGYKLPDNDMRWPGMANSKVRVDQQEGCVDSCLSAVPF